jgi:hypothetical protein
MEGRRISRWEIIWYVLVFVIEVASLLWVGGVLQGCKALNLPAPSVLPAEPLSIYPLCKYPDCEKCPKCGDTECIYCSLPVKQ